MYVMERRVCLRNRVSMALYSIHACIFKDFEQSYVTFSV